jgi:hypothetical protein
MPERAVRSKTDPLGDVLRAAADRAADAEVRTWLRALLRHGDRASGRAVGGKSPAQAGGGRKGDDR